MKEFFKKYGYTSVILIVDQIALALFGFALATATGLVENKWLQWGAGIFSVLFYLSLVYTTVWKEGARDRISADYNRIPRRPWLGACIGLVSAIPNVILFIFIALGSFIPLLEGIGGACKVIALLFEGMYTGLLTIRIGDSPLNTMWWAYFIIILPLIATTFLGYFAGFHNFRIFPQGKKEIEKIKR